MHNGMYRGTRTLARVEFLQRQLTETERKGIHRFQLRENGPIQHEHVLAFLRKHGKHIASKELNDGDYAWAVK